MVAREDGRKRPACAGGEEGPGVQRAGGELVEVDVGEVEAVGEAVREGVAAAGRRVREMREEEKRGAGGEETYVWLVVPV